MFVFPTKSILLEGELVIVNKLYTRTVCVDNDVCSEERYILFCAADLRVVIIIITTGPYFYFSNCTS